MEQRSFCLKLGTGEGILNLSGKVTAVNIEMTEFERQFITT